MVTWRDLAPLPQRFWNKVIRRPDGTGCWDWTGSRDTIGYGLFHVGSKRDGTARNTGAHRLVLERKLGRLLAEGEEARHSCDRRHCVNPDHLDPGSHRQNMADMFARGRARPPRGEKHGNAKLTEADIRAIRSDPRSHQEVADALGVTRANIGYIRARKAWRHVS